MHHSLLALNHEIGYEMNLARAHTRAHQRTKAGCVRAHTHGIPSLRVCVVRGQVGLRLPVISIHLHRRARRTKCADTCVELQRQSGSQQLTFGEQSEDHGSESVPHDRAAHDGVLIDFLLVSDAAKCLRIPPPRRRCVCVVKNEPVKERQAQ